MPVTELRGGRYALLKPLGEGGQGETFEAVDKREGRLVAVKRFRVGKAKAWKDVELAEREATTLASLDHDLLPHYVEHFEEDGALVLVMELIEGESLASLRKRGHRASLAEISRLLSDASRALTYLHGRAPPVVHRDLKPGNVIKRPDGSFAFVDFGAVRDRLKPAGGSTVVGTFGYMAPEQFQGRASEASDVYGIGATALALLTGTEPEDLPHKGLGIDVALAVPKATPRSLVRTLEAMLEPDPDRRASTIAAAIARGAAGGGGSKTAAKEVRRAAPSPRRTEAPRSARAARKAERKAQREERKARKARRRARAPFLVRTIAQLGILVAQVVVWIVVGLALPMVFGLLSMIFGAAMRRAASACFQAAKRAGASLSGASGWLSGEGREEKERAVESEVARLRVTPDDVLRRVRAVTPEQAQAEAIRRAELSDAEAEAWADEVATREAEQWEPPEAWQEEDRKAPKRRR